MLVMWEGDLGKVKKCCISKQTKRCIALIFCNSSTTWPKLLENIEIQLYIKYLYKIMASGGRLVSDLKSWVDNYFQL